MFFKVIGKIREIETIAIGHGINNLKRLNRIYGRTNWRKLKGICQVKLGNGTILNARYIGMKDMASGKKKLK